MASTIDFKAVTKLYGKNIGVSDISLQVEKGAVFGFLGPNGAGKSTTINMLVDLLRPTSGHIKIFGLDSQKDSLAIRRRVGFLSGDMSLDERLTGLQQLTFFANLRGGVPLKRITDFASVLEVNLNRRIKTLSRGNRQKVGLISALMHDPDLLILDEPTTGLDPIVQAQFNRIILDHKKRGKTTFVSSHILSEIQEICDHVAFIREGKIIDVQHMREIKAASPKHVSIFPSSPKLLTEIKKLDGANIIETTDSGVRMTYSGPINALLKLLSQHTIKDVSIQEADLETIFMSYYGDENVK